MCYYLNVQFQSQRVNVITNKITSDVKLQNKGTYVCYVYFITRSFKIPEKRERGIFVIVPLTYVLHLFYGGHSLMDRISISSLS